MKMRSYIPKGPHHRPYISEEEVFERVLTAIRTLKAMPDRERRFLVSGTKAAWPQPLVEFADLVAQAEQVPDDNDRPPRVELRRKDIDDALIAGRWFASLAIIPENIDEFEKRVAEFRAGRSKSPQVDDQRVLGWYAAGFSIRHIGQRINLNEHQAERRLREIARSLWRLANGTARFADIASRQRERKRHQARALEDRAGS